MVKIKRALVSVSDKTGLEEFVKVLDFFGIEILSTGGTAKLIQNLGVKVKKVSDFTGMQEMLGGRVKTLHPKIHGALLAVRNNPEHLNDAKEYGLEYIDLVVVNLYPFEQISQKSSVSLEEVIENIDIGGPAMLRSAAKNYKNVAVICNPQRYQEIISEIKIYNGAITPETCFQLAVEAFSRTTEYDQAIAVYLKDKMRGSRKNVLLPKTLNLKFNKVQDLRYGENPHQHAAFYRAISSKLNGISAAKQLHGKELSFNNIMDLDAVLNILRDFNQPLAVIVKHTNPCGAAIAENIGDAYAAALDCDPMSAFGSIVGTNRTIDKFCAKKMISSGFIECIFAPGYKQDALEILKSKKNVRLMQGDCSVSNLADYNELDFKRVLGGVLVQDKDSRILDLHALKTTTIKEPSKEQMESLLFAWSMVKHIKSNAIVLSRDTKLVGIGAGQMSRVDSVIIAINKAKQSVKGAVLASDAFFPKKDAIEQAADAGISAIIQPGGSIRDKEVIAAADKAGIAMVFTGTRHFKH
ncbi:MAG: bifunctional phosphoribosylaminoimidazolecarboxamide formyltransferase/inosine monophosphate cyclohydrolase [Candidatus Omnitrophota bacterium]|nr:MAG: bifunctional phosphoribosylaminoimidazolecarboxamide formyltransferase/inosine monophosphate cyclohydrolase [Candidatus Omnitrophota bacterium]